VAVAKVKLVALGTVRDALGWDESAHEIEVPGTTVGDALRSVPAREGGTLLELLTDEDGAMRPEYMIRLDGG
jgi:hypothetical protein